jgi:glutaredoxin 3
MTAPEVTIYLTDWCPYCARARSLLDKKGAHAREIDIEAEPGARAEMLSRSAGRTSVPQIFIGAEHVGGCDELYALDASGRLDKLLKPTGA